MQETCVWFLHQDDPLEKGMATHSSILAWRIQWMKEHGRLQSMRSQRVGHDWATNTFLGFPGGSDGKESHCNAGSLSLIPASGRSPGERNGYPLQYSCLENSMDKGAWRAIIYGVAKSWTWLTSNNSLHFQCISSCNFSQHKCKVIFHWLFLFFILISILTYLMPLYFKKLII